MQDIALYLQLGWEHIISQEALDHQLFVLALVASFGIRDFKKILILITAFTIGHSTTLILGALNIIQIPTNWVEFLIPVTIAFTAVHNIIRRNSLNQLIRWNYFLAIIFGFVHGMGFANVARMTLVESQNLFFSLFGFNIGVELGQVFVVVCILFISKLLNIIFKFSAKEWLLMASSVVLALAFGMISERFASLNF